MSTVTPSAASYSVRSVSRLRGGNARVALGALLAFIFIVYACPGTVWPELAPYLPAKWFALSALAALGVSFAVYGRRLVGGAWVGAGLACVLALALASPLWSINPEASTSTSIELAKFVVIYFVVVNVIDSSARLRAILWTVVLCSLIPCIGAIKNYVLGENLVEGNRAAWISMFGNPDELAYYLAAATPMALALREMATRKSTRLLLFGIIGLYGAGVFLGASRGGILTLGAVVAVWWVRELRRGKVGVWAAIAVAAALLFVPAHVWSRTHTLAQYEEDYAAMGRIWTFQAGWKMFLSSPWGGIGSGTFVEAYPAFAPMEAVDNVAAQAAHNSFMQVLAEEGIFALAAFVIAIVAAFVYTRRANARHAHDTVDSASAAMQGALLAFVLSSLTGGIALSWPIYWALGIAAALPRIRAAEEAAHA